MAPRGGRRNVDRVRKAGTDVGEHQIVVCELKTECYGIDISKVFEIIRLQPITAVPAAPSYVDGVINLRGRIVPVVDLAVMFGMPHTAESKASRIVVVGSGESRVGLIVDGVSQVLMVAEDAVDPTPPVAGGGNSDYLRGIARVADSLIMLLDLDAIFGEQELAFAA